MMPISARMGNTEIAPAMTPVRRRDAPWAIRHKIPQKETRRIPENDGGQVACLARRQFPAPGRKLDDEVVVHRIRDRMHGPVRQTAGRQNSEKSRQGQTNKCKKHQRCAPGKVAGQGCSVAKKRLFQIVHLGGLLPFACDQQATYMLLNCSHFGANVKTLTRTFVNKMRKLSLTH